MNTITINLETIRGGDFAIMHQVNWHSGGGWLFTTRELAEACAKKHTEDAIGITERHIHYK